MPYHINVSFVFFNAVKHCKCYIIKIKDEKHSKNVAAIKYMSDIVFHLFPVAIHISLCKIYYVWGIVPNILSKHICR